MIFFPAEETKEVIWMKLSIKEEKDLSIVTVEGRLDTLTAPELEKQCLELLEGERKNLVLDFSSLEYISSAGLRSVLVVGKKSKANGSNLTLCGLSGLVEEVFNMSGFDSFFPIYPSVEKILEGDKSNG